MKRRFLILAIGFSIVLPACATQKYYWGSYESALYKYYKNPGDLESFAEKLAETIERGERQDKVPPGMYAEYGYVLLVQGKSKEAILYFEREKQKWPESTSLMDTMIRTANFQQEKDTGVQKNDVGAGVTQE